MNRGKDKLNIVYIGRYNKSEVLSGPEKVAKRIFHEHAKHTITHFIQYYFDGTKYSFLKKMLGIDTEIVDGGSKIYTAGIFKIYSLLKTHKPDIIHIITFERFAFIAVLYKFFNNVKIIYNEHGVIAYENEIKKNNFFYSLKDKFAERELLKSSDKIVFVSEQALDKAGPYYNIDEQKCIILANGIDSVFNINTVENNFSGKIKAVLHCQNKLHESGLNFLLEFNKAAINDIEYFVISETEFSLPDNFIKVKPMSPADLTSFYNDKHFFLALNSYDTFSIAAAEAMSCGLIPIVTKQTGISRFIENEVNGYCINYGDTSALKAVFENFSKLSAERKQTMSTEASKIYNEINWENIYGSYYNIYKQLK